MIEQVAVDKPACPVCSNPAGKVGRSRGKMRPEIRLSVAYVSKIGAQCGDMAETIQRAASRACNDAEARELALISERLMQMKELFL